MNTFNFSICGIEYNIFIDGHAGITKEGEPSKFSLVIPLIFGSLPITIKSRLQSIDLDSSFEYLLKDKSYEYLL